MFEFSFSGLIIVFHVAMAVRFLAVRAMPLFVPQGRVKVVALGTVGGLVGSALGGLVGLGPHVSTVHLGGAAIGSLLIMLLAGIWPFLRIMVGRG
ncbi:MAG: hypothetical protein HYX92_20315 [Chloroflexi bacterium]|nr:hypothetical protein [Chloroflexota bacterium]